MNREIVQFIAHLAEQENWDTFARVNTGDNTTYFQFRTYTTCGQVLTLPAIMSGNCINSLVHNLRELAKCDLEIEIQEIVNILSDKIEAASKSGEFALRDA